MKKNDREFFKYQKLCYEELEDLLDKGWNNFKFNQIIINLHLNFFKNNTISYSLEGKKTSKFVRFPIR